MINRREAFALLLVLAGVQGCGQQQLQPDPTKWGTPASAKILAGMPGEPSSRALSIASNLTLSESCGFSAGGNGEPPGECWITGWQAPDGQTTIYDIRKPVVNSPNTNYPAIALRPGDVVTVDARGCVQTGGLGRTWKRYVIPLPFEGQYYGNLTVPGGVVTLPNATTIDGTPLPPRTPIFTLIGKEIRIADAPSTDSACVSRSNPVNLQLGYVDDDYSDNGYWGHDDGNFDQCAGAPGAPAEVLVQVRHAVPGPYSDGLAYDLVPNCLDDNYLFLNPRWGWQSPIPGPTPVPIDVDHPATAQFTEIDNPSLLKSTGFVLLAPITSLFGGVVCSVTRGHRNWFDVSYTGRVIWDTHDGGIKGDDDYNLWLYTPPVGSSEYSEGGMINEDVRRRIRLEFDSDETIDEFTTCGLHPGDNCKPRFQFSWWNRFRHLVDDDGAAAHREIHGHLATVVGLMGVDYVHDPNSGNELHPVHVFAVHLDRSSSDPTHFTDHWAIFARNWGNEGECGALDHYLLANDLTLRLAPTIDPSFRQYIVGQSTAVPRASISANFADASPVGFLPAADPTHPDLLLNFSLHEPGAHTWYAGDFDIEWTVSQPLPVEAFLPVEVDVDAPPPAVASSTALFGAEELAAAGSDGESESGDAKLTEIWDAMTPAQQADAMALYRSMFPPRPMPDVYAVGVARIDQLPSRAQQVPDVGQGPLPDWQLTRRAAQLNAICAATWGAPAGLLGSCADGPPVTILTSTGGAPGKNGWLMTPVDVMLTARDVSGAGVDHTEFSFDGSTFMTYAGPFTVPEGEGAVRFRSLGRDGLVEVTRQQQFRIDTRPPASSATSTPAGAGVTLAYEVTDPVPGSGAAGIHVIYRGVDGDKAQPYSTFEPGAQGVVTLPTRCSDIEFWAEDQAGNDEVTHQHLADAAPPDLIESPPAICLWPPNHGRFRFELGKDILAQAQDECDPSPQVRIVAVTINEPDSTPGSGQTTGDATFSSRAVCVRAERAGPGTGRVYIVTLEATDYSGNATRRQVQITVPHSQTPGCGVAGTAIADGVLCE